MISKPHKFQQTVSVIFALVSLGLIGFAVLWPNLVSYPDYSRLAVAILAFLIGVITVLLNPKFRTGLILGFREFIKATKDLRPWDDDDDGPLSA